MKLFLETQVLYLKIILPTKDNHYIQIKTVTGMSTIPANIEFHMSKAIYLCGGVI